VVDLLTGSEQLEIPNGSYKKGQIIFSQKDLIIRNEDNTIVKDSKRSSKLQSSKTKGNNKI